MSLSKKLTALNKFCCSLFVLRREGSQIALHPANTASDGSDYTPFSASHGQLRFTTTPTYAGFRPLLNINQWPRLGNNLGITWCFLRRNTGLVDEARSRYRAICAYTLQQKPERYEAQI